MLWVSLEQIHLPLKLALLWACGSTRDLQLNPNLSLPMVLCTLSLGTLPPPLIPNFPLFTVVPILGIFTVYLVTDLTKSMHKTKYIHGTGLHISTRILVQSFPYPTFPLSTNASRGFKFSFCQLPFQLLHLHIAIALYLSNWFLSCFHRDCSCHSHTNKKSVIFFCAYQENILKMTEKKTFFLVPQKRLAIFE